MKATVRIVVDQAPGQMPMVTVVAFPSQGGDLVPLTEPCASSELLEAQLEELHETLKELLLEARAKFAAQVHREPAALVPERPEELWELLESKPDLEEMMGIFNSLEEHRRRQLADYILAHVNVFKGAGALFAQHYDEDRGLLA